MSPTNSPDSSPERTPSERALLAISTIGFAVFVLRMDGRPTVVFLGVLVVLLVVFGVELRRVELPPGVAITFARRRANEGNECRPVSPERQRGGSDSDKNEVRHAARGDDADSDASCPTAGGGTDVERS